MLDLEGKIVYLMDHIMLPEDPIQDLAGQIMHQERQITHLEDQVVDLVVEQLMDLVCQILYLAHQVIHLEDQLATQED